MRNPFKKENTWNEKKKIHGMKRGTPQPNTPTEKKKKKKNSHKDVSWFKGVLK